MWGFTKFFFKQMLKVSALYLKKQKSFIPENNIFLALVSKHAKIIPKDGASCSNFQWRFWVPYPVHFFIILCNCHNGSIIFLRSFSNFLFLKGIFLSSLVLLCSLTSQFYESWIFCLFTFWVFFQNKNFELMSKYIQKCQYNLLY